MLKYKEYRNKFTESIPEATTGNIESQIDSAIDKWIQELKRTFMTDEVPKRGMWDRFKNTLANIWHGRQDTANPYKYINKFGDNLGKEESVNSLSLSDYQQLKNICESLEEIINEDETENLRLMRIIDQKGQELKATLKKIITGTSVAQAEEEPEEDNHQVQIGAKPADSPIEPTQTIQTTQANSPAKGNITPAHGPNSIMVGPGQFNYGDYNNAPTNAEPEEKAKTPFLGKTPWEKLEDDEKYTTRPTSGKRATLPWDELTPEEHEKWNVYGGGAERKNTRTPFKDLPWLIRLGDPRLEALIKLTKNSRQMNTLQNSGRIETSENPVKSREDLNKRIEQIKIRMEEEKKKAEELKRNSRTLNGKELTGDIGATLANARNNISTPATLQKPEPIPEPVQPPPKFPLDFKVGDLPTNQVTHSPDNALGTPAHKLPFKTEDMPKDGEEPKSTPASEPIQTTAHVEPPNDDEDDPLADDDRLNKNKLMNYMINPKYKIHDDKTRNELLMKVNGVRKKNKEEMLAIRDEIWRAIEAQEMEQF